MHQRWMLSQLARDCRIVVITRARVIGAASVIQRAWRVFRARKLDKAGVANSVGEDDNGDDISVTMLQARTQDPVVQSETDVEALETTDVDIWLL